MNSMQLDESRAFQKRLRQTASKKRTKHVFRIGLTNGEWLSFKCPDMLSQGGCLLLTEKIMRETHNLNPKTAYIIEVCDTNALPYHPASFEKINGSHLGKAPPTTQRSHVPSVLDANEWRPLLSSNDLCETLAQHGIRICSEKLDFLMPYNACSPIALNKNH